MRRVLFAAVLALAACDQTGVQAPSAETAAQAATFAPSNLPAFFDCLRERSGTLVSAHRGGPERGYAENAIPTFERTLTQVPAFMEVDVARTQDGTLVLMHDDTVDRTTNGTGEVDRLTAAQFSALQLKDNNGTALDAHPPTLREALAWAAGKTVLELDVKPGVSYEELAREVDAAGAMDRVIFVVYSVNAASRLARVAPQAMINVTIESAADLDTLQRRGVDLTHIIAWTGDEEPNSALNVALGARGVETNFGTMGRWDRQFAREGQDQYAAFADTGLTMISTNRPAAAVRDLDANDGDAQGYSALQCVGAD